MEMILYAIDGACRRNGQPDCTSSGGVFVYKDGADGRFCKTMDTYEYGSTNQRGELCALLLALDDIRANKPEGSVYVVTDSEYIFNAMSKEWYSSWHFKGWRSSSGEAMKNSDIWGSIFRVMREIQLSGVEPVFYHIKGHCIPFGRVTAGKLLTQDSSGRLLLREVTKKFDVCKGAKAEVFEAAQQLSEKNNGFRLPSSIFKRMVVCNVMADAVATMAVDKADARRKW